MPRAGIALGSNLGQRLANLQAAVGLLQRIARPGAAVVRAPIYQTAPVHCPDASPDFYNTVVEISYDGTPGELLAHTQAIESQLGRTRSAARNAPRTIDIDLLYFGSQTHAAADLVLPHPRLTQRRFVLQPLADIRPDLVLPGHHLTIAAHLARLRSAEPAVTLVAADW
jgi:2-amino-4-hydroxy-6-hydroxymethyldihydropteridine diphosphokinase